MATSIRYELPALGFDYDALEPAYSAELLELHYASHHKAYVEGANKALDSLAEARGKGDFSHLNQLEKDREPILITQHGVPSAYLVDVETFEALQRRMALLEGIARGEKALEEGRSLTHKQAKQRMSRWLK